MGQSLPSIGDVVRLETRRGKLVDVDKYVRHFEPLFPDFSADQIRDEIMKAVCGGGGGAVWGLEGAMLLIDRSQTPGCQSNNDPV